MIEFRKTLIRLGLEVTFLRHLTEFYRLGLIDSDAMYEIFSVLKDRDLSQQEGEEEPQFWFANRLVQQAEKKERKERNDGWKGVLRDDVDVR